jgi:hypothetical protein
MQRNNENEDFVSGGVIKETAKKIHEICTCGAEGDYAKGWSDGVEKALSILLSSTGYTMDEVLETEVE